MKNTHFLILSILITRNTTKYTGVNIVYNWQYCIVFDEKNSVQPVHVGVFCARGGMYSYLFAVFNFSYRVLNIYYVLGNNFVENYFHFSYIILHDFLHVYINYIL